MRDSEIHELQEELGIFVAAQDLVNLAKVSSGAGVIKTRTRIYVGTVTESAGSLAEGELGHVEMISYNKTEIDNSIALDKIQDASTLVPLLKQRMEQETPVRK